MVCLQPRLNLVPQQQLDWWQFSEAKLLLYLSSSTLPQREGGRGGTFTGCQTSCHCQPPAGDHTHLGCGGCEPPPMVAAQAQTFTDQLHTRSCDPVSLNQKAEPNRFKITGEGFCLIQIYWY